MKATVLLGVMSVAVAAPLGYTMAKRHQEKIHLIQTQIAQEQVTQQAQADVAALLRQIELYHKRLPSELNPSWLVTEVVALGERAGLQLTRIAQEQPQSLQAFTRLAVTLEFSTSYHQLGAFLDLIERSEQFIRVERLEAKSDPSRAEGTDASIRLTLSTVYLPPVLRGAGR